MNRIHAVSLALTALAAACSIQWPDPRSVEPPYRCDADSDCISGFTCAEHSCLDESTFGSELVTVTARVPAGQTVGYTIVHGVELDTEVQPDGSFTLQIPVHDPQEVLTVCSRGSSSSEPAVLAAILGPADQAAAGVPVLLTPFTTVAFVATQFASEYALPTTVEELVAAEQRMAVLFPEDMMLDAAAVVQWALDDPTAFRAVYHTISTMDVLTRGADALFTATSYMSSEDASLLARTRSALLSDFGLAAPWPAVPSRCFSEPDPEYGRMPADGPIYVTFGDVSGHAGAGTYHPRVPSSGRLPVVSSTTWVLAPDGASIVLRPSPAVSERFFMDGSELATYLEDEAASGAIWLDRRYIVTLDVEEMTIRRLAGGTGGAWVSISRTGTLRASESIAGAPDVHVALLPIARVWVMADEIRTLGWPSELEGTSWAMPVVLPSDLPLYPDPVAPGYISTAAIVDFGAGNQATVRGGVLGTQTLLATWTKGAADVVTLTFPDSHVERISVWDDLQSIRLLSLDTVATDPGGVPVDLLGYDQGYPVADPSALAATVVTAPGESWIGGSWVFAEDGTATETDHDYDYFWHTDGDAIVIEGYCSADVSGTCSGPRLCTQSSDPSCYLDVVIRWEPVAISADELRVIESASRCLWSSDIHWNGSQWVTYLGTAVDLSSFGYTTAPRIAVHHRSVP